MKQRMLLLITTLQELKRYDGYEIIIKNHNIYVVL